MHMNLIAAEFAEKIGAFAEIIRRMP